MNLRRRKRVKVFLPPSAVEVQQLLRAQGRGIIADHLLLAALEPQIVNALRTKGSLPEDVLTQVRTIIGTIASGVADDASEPVKIGGVYRAAAPTFVDGNRVEAQFDSRGSQKTIPYTTAGAVVTNGTMSTDAQGNPSGYFNAAMAYIFNGASWDRLRAAVIFKHFASTAITAGVGATIWTPAGGKKFRLMGWLISSSAAGQLLFGDNVVGTIIARSEALVAAAASKLGDGDIGNGILSAVANNVLKLDGPTGNVAGMVWGTEE